MVLSIATLVIAIPAAIWQIPAAPLDPGMQDAVVQLAPELVGDADDRPIYIESQPDVVAPAIEAGLVLAAERAGLDVAVSSEGLARFGSHRTSTPDDRVHYLVARLENVEGLEADGWQAISVFDPFTPAEHVELDRLEAETETLVAQKQQAIDNGATPDEIEQLNIPILVLVSQTDALLDDRVSIALMRKGD
ncbi:hypothetical protein BH10ACT3_BH10ACT3_06220 [soil metagenome]